MACSFALAGCDSCDREPETARVGRVVLNLPREFDNQTEVREAIRATIEERLADAEAVSFAAGGPGADHVVHVTAGEVVRGDQEGGQGRPVEVRLRPKHDGREHQAVGRGLPLADLASSVMTGFDDAWRVVEQQRWMSVARDQRLVDSLNHPDPRMRDFIIQLLGERRSVAAVDALCERLRKEPRPELVLRAVGALVAIGDARAAEPLIELTRRRDPRFVIQVVYALGEIGGPTAEGYLVTLASGHPLEAVQAAAAEALAELEAAAPAGAAAP